MSAVAAAPGRRATPAAAIMERQPEKDPASSGAARAGSILAGKYRVERVIGRGGMGIVVAATHLHLGEQVAIKLLLPGAPVRAGAFERFLREGRAFARLRSEHVARVHDAGILDSGEPYLVLEYLKGVDLRTLIRERGRVPVDTAVLYVLQVCEALAEAHALGIIHRDLKPGNIFLTRRADGSEAVKVIDFGISKITSAAAAGGGGDDEQLTGSDAAMGTPSYMAPEQMRSARAADVRADIWSLGAVLYGLVTGSPPFAGTTMIEVYDHILKGAPLLGAARDDVPASLEAIVARCLRFDRTARYDDVGELAAALAEVGPEAGRLSAERAIRTARGLPVADDLLDGERRFVDGPSAENPPRIDAETTKAGDSAASDPAPTSERPTTALTRDPSWPHGGGADRSAPPSSRDTASSSLIAKGSTGAASSSTQRAWLDRRTGILVVVGGVVVAIGGAAIGYGLRRSSADPAHAASITGASADPARPIPAAVAAPSAALPTSASSPWPPPPAGIAPTTATPTKAGAPARWPEGSRRAAPPPAPASGSGSVSARVPGLAETPD